MREVRAGQFYRHFKGGTYQTLAVAEHTETGERLVVYQALYGDFRVYARPYDMFVSEVDRGKYPQAGQRYRFEEIELQSAMQGRERSVEPQGCAPEHEKVEPQSGVPKGGMTIPPENVVAERKESGEPGQEPATVQASEARGAKTENGAVKPEVSRDPEAIALEEQVEAHTYAEDEVNPILLEFLDADTLEEKTHILIRYRNQMDESLLNSIAIALDIVVEKKGVQDKYDEILNCLSMMKHFETTCLR